MNSKNPGWKAALLVSTLCFTSDAISKTWHGFQPLASLLAGVALTDDNHYFQSYVGTDEGIFSYQNQDQSQTAGLLGFYLGMEKQLANPVFIFQAGVELLRVGSTKTLGNHWAGNEPETSTAYQYSYRFRAQQLLAVAKLLKTCRQIYHPYVSLGLGASFNHLSHFNASTVETGSINLTPSFAEKTRTTFSYQLGLGFDTDLTENLRFGIGYQFSDLGRASFKNGRVIFNQYTFPAPFNFKTDHNYSNQFFAQLTYLV